MARRGPSLALVLLLLGCGTSVTETYINGPPPTMTSRGPHSVLIYASSPPTRPHVDVAKLELEERQGIGERGADFAIDRLRTRAAQLGCDGVVVGGIRERDGMPPGTAYYLLDPGATTLHGTCIVFTGKALAATPNPPQGECPCQAR